MEKKKNPKADLTNKKILFFLGGLLISQSFILYAFSHTQYETIIRQVAREFVEDEIEVIENTEQVYVPPPPPPPPQIEVAEDDDDADEDIEIEDTDFDAELEIAPPPPPPPPPSSKPVEDKIFEVVEIQPEFPGGQAAMLKFISENFKYPEDAKRFEIEGRVMITFLVDSDGSITNVRALLPPERQLGYGLEDEAIRVIKKMPKWNPGMQRNKAVKVQFTMPIMCRLDY